MWNFCFRVFLTGFKGGLIRGRVQWILIPGCINCIGLGIFRQYWSSRITSLLPHSLYKAISLFAIHLDFRSQPFLLRQSGVES